MEKEKEEILLKHVGKLALSGLRWKSLSDRKERIFEAMQEFAELYATHQLQASEARLKELEGQIETIKNMARCYKGNLIDNPKSEYLKGKLGAVNEVLDILENKPF